MDDEQHNKDRQPKNPTEAYAGCKTKQGREGARVEMQHRVDQEKLDVSEGTNRKSKGGGIEQSSPAA